MGPHKHWRPDFTEEERLAYNAYLRKWYKENPKRWSAIDIASKKRRRSTGLCTVCGKPAWDDMSGQCFTHWLLTQFSQEDFKPRRGWGEHSRNIRSKLVVRMLARYNAILAGKPLSTSEEARLEAYQIRRELKIAWGETAGLGKLARIIQRVEQKARRTI